MITAAFFVLLFLLIATTTQQQPSKVGFAYSPNPDVIRCGNYFYYLTQTSPSLSKFNADTGSILTIESYDVSNGRLSNKIGSLPQNCENETIQSLWTNDRAFRLFNLDRAPNRSIQNHDGLPDVIQCQDVCGRKSRNDLISDNKTYNIATQVSTTTNPSISMTRIYPDFFKCQSQSLYIHFISTDQTQVTYRSKSPSVIVQIQFQNGRYSSSRESGAIRDCVNKSITTLINEGKAFNLNTPILQCPKDITSTNPKVKFSAFSNSGLNLFYSQTSGQTFPIGQKTTVMVIGSHYSGINLMCSFGITILDNQAPSLSCPANVIQQNNRVVNYPPAIATDNSGASPCINQSHASGSQFPFGVTMVTFTATDGSGNQSRCTTSITIEDKILPSIACPDNITQIDNRIVNFPAASASDNSGVSPTITYSHASGSQFPIGMTMVTATATDNASNFSQCTFQVNVIIPKISGGSESNTGVIVGSVFGVISVAGIIVLVIWIAKCKKNKRGCFRQKQNKKTNINNESNEIKKDEINEL